MRGPYQTNLTPAHPKRHPEFPAALELRGISATSAPEDTRPHQAQPRYPNTVLDAKTARTSPGGVYAAPPDGALRSRSALLGRDLRFQPGPSVGATRSVAPVRSASGARYRAPPGDRAKMGLRHRSSPPAHIGAMPPQALEPVPATIAINHPRADLEPWTERTIVGTIVKRGVRSIA